jgi:hypothetical protein
LSRRGARKLQFNRQAAKPPRPPRIPNKVKDRSLMILFLAQKKAPGRLFSESGWGGYI